MTNVCDPAFVSKGRPPWRSSRRRCRGYTIKINNFDHLPPHCHVNIQGRNKRVSLETLRILNPPPHEVPAPLRRGLKDLQEELLAAWDDVTLME